MTEATKKRIYYTVFDTELGGVMECSPGIRRAKTVKLDRPMIGLGRVVDASLVYESAAAAEAAYRAGLEAQALDLEAQAAALRARARQEI